MACGILVPQPGTEPTALAVKAWSQRRENGYLFCLLFFFLKGYSFVAPSILFKRNAAVMDPLQFHMEVDRPGEMHVARSAMLKV